MKGFIKFVRPIQRTINLILLLSFSIFFFSFNMQKVTPHIDETAWIESSKYFQYFFIDRNFSDKLWNQFESFDKPPLGKYLVGVSLFLTGNLEKAKLIKPYSHLDIFTSPDDFWNILHISRVTMMIFAVLSSLLIFLITTKCFGHFCGGVSYLLFVFHPQVSRHLLRGMPDSPLLFFILLGLYLTMELWYFLFENYTQNSQKRVLFSSAVVGIVAALAIGVKLNGGIILIVSMLSLLTPFMPFFKFKFFPEKAQKLMIFKTLVTIGLSCYLTFLLFSPHLYHRPLKGLVEMWNSRLETVKGQYLTNTQSAFFPEGIENSKNYFQAFKFIFQVCYGSFGQLGAFGKKWFFLGPLTSLIMTSLALIGFLHNFSSFISSLRQKTSNLRETFYLKPDDLFFIFSIVVFLCVFIWIPFSWERYVIPFLPSSIAYVGLGLQKSLENLEKLTRRLQKLVSVDEREPCHSQL